MSNLSICYCGSHLDYSGYGSANRAFTVALWLAGVDLKTQIESYVRDRANFGWQGKLCEALERREMSYDIKILHVTPDEYPKYSERGKYHIGHLFFETTSLPKDWIKPINKMDEIWTSSEQMAGLFKKSGVNVPIYWFPQPIDTMPASYDYKKYIIPNHKGFLFYSIFQWIKRKNPEDLLKTYWRAFAGKQDVSLLIKTHRVNYDESEFQRIKDDIRKWKNEMPQRHYPKVILCKRLLADDDIMRLHATGDCYVVADHGEGWNRVLHEALMMGKVAISTSRGGLHEYLREDHYFRIPTKYVPVIEEKWIPWYTRDMKWANPDTKVLADSMQYVYNNYRIAQAKALIAQEFVKGEFNYRAVGDKMKERLEVIYKAL